MSPETHAVLLDADDRHSVWQPSKPNREKARVRKSEIQAVRDDLERLLGVALSLDRSVQDATYFTALQVFEPGANAAQSWASGPEGVAVFEVRFSSFGRLTSALSQDGWLAARGASLADVAAVLRRYGFRYVGAEELRAPYDGPNHKARNGDRDLTWWVRYFDYL